MRLANGIVLDKDTTFGELKFSALRREVRIQNEDGSVSDENRFDTSCFCRDQRLEIDHIVFLPACL
ncbi:hypothetical protein EfmJHP36_27250 [Enterococcus faecium]|nr:hypothetical protein EfmJHP36_27250 [Enterococcus faecium]